MTCTRATPISGQGLTVGHQHALAVEILKTRRARQRREAFPRDGFYDLKTLCEYLRDSRSLSAGPGDIPHGGDSVVDSVDAMISWLL